MQVCQWPYKHSVNNCPFFFLLLTLCNPAVPGRLQQGEWPRLLCALEIKQRESTSLRQHIIQDYENTRWNMKSLKDKLLPHYRKKKKKSLSAASCPGTKSIYHLFLLTSSHKSGLSPSQAEIKKFPQLYARQTKPDSHPPSLLLSLQQAKALLSSCFRFLFQSRWHKWRQAELHQRMWP